MHLGIKSADGCRKETVPESGRALFADLSPSARGQQFNPVKSHLRAASLDAIHLGMNSQIDALETFFFF